MADKGISLRRTVSAEINVDIAKCIICQRQTELTPIGQGQGRKRVIEAAAIRDDIVRKRIKTVLPDNFV